MALLEKQKLLKLTKSKIVATKPSSDISVTIANDLFNHQPKTNDQTVRLNGTDTSTWKENKTEIKITFRSVDSEILKDNRNVSRISTVTVVTDTGSKTNNSKQLPEMCVTPSVTPKDIVSIKPVEPTEKSTNSLTNFSTLSEHQRNGLLQKSESEYMCHR